MEENKIQPEQEVPAPAPVVEPKSKYDYGPNDKPKGRATVVPDEPVDLFPPEHEDLEEPTTSK